MGVDNFFLFSSYFLHFIFFSRTFGRLFGAKVEKRARLREIPSESIFMEEEKKNAIPLKCTLCINHIYTEMFTQCALCEFNTKIYEWT